METQVTPSDSAVTANNANGTAQQAKNNDVPVKQDETNVTNKDSNNATTASQTKETQAIAEDSENHQIQNDNNKTSDSEVSKRVGTATETSVSGISSPDSPEYDKENRKSVTKRRDSDIAPTIVKNKGKLYLKRRGPFSKWKSYHVVLDEKQYQMSFYKSLEDYDKLASCKTAIDLRFVERIVPLKQGILKLNFPFKLQRRAGLSTVKVASESEEERAKWITTLEDLSQKIRASPDRDSPMEDLQKASTLPTRGISITSETQTSSTEAIASSAPEEDVQIRPKKLSKQGAIKLDPVQLASIKLKRIDSEKEESETKEEEVQDRESYDPEQKFGVQLRRISSERRSTPPKSPDSEHVSEFKIKFNSLKRTKSPIIPMSDTLRNTVGDITNKERLSPNARVHRKTSEPPRKRSPSPNIPISDAVKSVAKKAEDNVLSQDENEEESKICHATTNEILDFQVKPLKLKLGTPTEAAVISQNTEQTKLSDNVDEIKSDKNTPGITSSPNDKLLTEDGNSSKIVQSDKKISVNEDKKSFGERLSEESLAVESTTQIIGHSETKETASEESQNPIQERKESKVVHRSFSSITITSTARKSNTPQTPTSEQLDGEEFEKTKEIETIGDKEVETPKTHSENMTQDPSQCSSVSENTKHVTEENVQQEIDFEAKITPHSHEHEITLSDQIMQSSLRDSLPPPTSEITIAEIKFIESEDEMQTLELDPVNDTSADNIKDFMSQMINLDDPIIDYSEDNRNFKCSSINVVDSLPEGDHKLNIIPQTENTAEISKSDVQDTTRDTYTPENNGLSRISVSNIPEPCNNESNLPTPQKVNTSTDKKAEISSSPKKPARKKSSNSFYKRFNSLDSEPLLDENKITYLDKIDSQTESSNTIKIEINESEVAKETINDPEKTLTQPIIRRGDSLSVDDQMNKRPSDISLGSSDCDEPLPKFCFMGTSDRSSTGSAVLRNIISAAEKELEMLPSVEGHLEAMKEQANSVDISSPGFNGKNVSNQASEEVETDSLNSKNVSDKLPDLVPENIAEKSTISNHTELEFSIDQILATIHQENQILKEDHLVEQMGNISSNLQKDVIRSEPREESDYFPNFSSVEYRKSADSSNLAVPSSSEVLRTSGINGLKEYLDEKEQEEVENSRGAAISRLGHSVAIEKLRNETT